MMCIQLNEWHGEYRRSTFLLLDGNNSLLHTIGPVITCVVYLSCAKTTVGWLLMCWGFAKTVGIILGSSKSMNLWSQMNTFVKRIQGTTTIHVEKHQRQFLARFLGLWSSIDTFCVMYVVFTKVHIIRTEFTDVSVVVLLLGISTWLGFRRSHGN